MKIKLWDYSNRWANFEGIICPLFSLIWGILGAVYVLWINPGFQAMVAWYMSNTLAIAMLESFFYGILAVDLGWSFGLAKKIRKAVADSKLVVDWDKIKVSFQEHYQRLKKTPEWILPFKTKAGEFSVLMSEYVANLKMQNELRLAAYQKKQEMRLEKRKAKASAKAHKEDE